MAKAAKKPAKPVAKPAAKAALPKLKKPVMATLVAKAVKNVKPKPDAVASTVNNTAFEIEDDAYFPPRTRNGKASVYPFATLAIGQSFFISAAVDAAAYKDETEAAKAQTEESHRVANRMAGATRRFTKRNEGFRFSVRTLIDPSKGAGVRVKRIAQDSAAE